jgi:hypothetical protein
VLTVMPASEAIPAVVRTLVGASLRLIAQVDEVASRGSDVSQRLRSAAPVLPAARRSYDEL